MKIALSFSQGKAMVGYSFFLVIRPLVIYQKIFSERHASGNPGPNDTGLDFLLYEKAEQMGCKTNTHRVLYRGCFESP
jgi:hypothetical protein